MTPGIRYSTKDYIRLVSNIHNMKYDYSLVEYKNSHTKIKIICPIHGIFEQKPYQHLNGHGCKKCGDIKDGINKRKTTELFIKEAKNIHNDKYNYSLVKYVTNNIKVKIICPIHGEFKQTPSAHINHKQGCPNCSGNIKKTTKQFIKESKEIQGGKYDYSLVDYIGNKIKVKIICPIHGVFEQIPSDHIRGIGCSNCFESKGEKEIERLLKETKLKYIKQKIFTGCKYKRNLKFDFYLPEYNTCIEFDGQQHEEMYRFEKTNERLKIRQKRDQIKNEYCKNNNIRLIRIKYDESIEEKLILLLLQP